MYRQFYNLRLNPFKIEPDPEFLWLGEKHREGLATLQYGILENMGFILLTGDVGTGKTVLLHQLRKTLPAQVKVAVVQDPGIEVLDLYRFLSEDFEITDRLEGKANFLIQFKRFLIDAYAAQQQVLIIIDEAHRLSCELLDEIRALRVFHGVLLMESSTATSCTARGCKVQRLHRPGRPGLGGLCQGA